MTLEEQLMQIRNKFEFWFSDYSKQILEELVLGKLYKNKAYVYFSKYHGECFCLKVHSKVDSFSINYKCVETRIQTLDDLILPFTIFGMTDVVDYIKELRLQ